LEDAREAFGQKYGLSYQLYIKERTLVPIVEMTLNYKRALRFGMTPTIKITYRPTDSAKIIFDYEIYDSQTGEVYLTAHTTQVFMDMENNLLWYSPEFYTEWKKSVGLI
jgi:acyl-CoA thioester hydrolase